MSFLDPITAAGPATELDTTGAAVNVDQAAPPTAGQVLTATDATHATWQDPTGGGGGGGDASGLETAGAPVDVAAADPPVVGQVLMAIDATHAEWKVPGLHYDPSIRFWVDSSGEATIEPGTWGFVYTTPVGSTGVTVFVVSSLTAPPVDSRFGLYVSPSVSVPVTVSLIGASQIMGLDGVLASSVELRPGAMFEWVFYHEDSVAIWGLVSDTAHVAKAIATTGDPVDVSSAAPPEPGQVLGAVSETEAAWFTPSWALTYGDFSDAPEPGQWVIATGGGNVTLPTSAPLGSTVGVAIQVSDDNIPLVCDPSESIRFGNSQEAELVMRRGGYYEFTLVENGEFNAWIARGGSNESPAPLPYSTGASPHRANTWTRSSTALGDDVYLPNDALNGDSFGVFVDTGTADIYVSNAGHEVYAPDDSGAYPVAVPLTLVGPSYYEWLFSASDSTWYPRTNLKSLPPPPAHASEHERGGSDIVAASKLSESSGPTTLDIGAVTDGQYLQRSGSSIVGAALTASVDPALNNFRLSNNSNSVSSDSASTPVYLVSHTGNRISLYTGSEWQVCVPSSQPTVDMAGQSAGIPCDVFAVFSSATALTLELVAWASASARATAIVQTDGVWVKSGAPTRRYLGSLLPNSATTYLHQSNGLATNAGICAVWNQDNRLLGSFRWVAAFASWTATGTGWQNLNGVSTGKVTLLQGRSDNIVTAEHWGIVDAVGAASAIVGIGVNSSSTPAAGLRDSTNAAAGAVHSIRAEMGQRVTTIGVNNLQAIVNTSAATPIFYGTNGAQQSGLIARHWY